MTISSFLTLHAHHASLHLHCSILNNPTITKKNSLVWYLYSGFSELLLCCLTQVRCVMYAILPKRHRDTAGSLSLCLADVTSY